MYEGDRFLSTIQVSAAYESDGTRIHWKNALGRFIRLPEEARLAAYQVAKETAERMEADAPKANNKSPVRRRVSINRPPGRLKANIGAFKTDTGGMVDWNVKGTAGHWAAVEFGAAGHPITGPKGISFFGHIPPGPRKGEINVPMVNHPGNPAQPYIRPNVDWSKDELWRRVTGMGSTVSATSRGADFSFVGSAGSVYGKALGSRSRGGKKPL